CDVPEYCNGSSQLCQPDVFIQNGHPCQNNKAYCYNGMCQYYDAQCQVIFGSSSRNAPFACYEEIQPQSDRFGNCGLTNKVSDILCGKLVCSWPHKRLILRTNLSVFYTHRRDEICVVTYRGDG
uniref:ADAM metallopeptidase domain 9 n=1 Tax=Loxodonta africana TaxID=9785 RepID=G3U7L5_LOXAF